MSNGRIARTLVHPLTVVAAGFDAQTAGPYLNLRSAASLKIKS